LIDIANLVETMIVMMLATPLSIILKNNARSERRRSSRLLKPWNPLLLKE